MHIKAPKIKQILLKTLIKLIQKQTFQQSIFKNSLK